MPAELIAVALLALIAAAVQTSVGFGSGLLFVPAATLIVGAEPSVATMLVVIPLVGAVLYTVDTPRTSPLDVAPVALVSLLSVPLGVWLLTQSDEGTLRLLVGLAVLLSVAVDRLRGRDIDAVHAPQLRWAAITGLTSGLMRGATSLGGPPLVLYYQWLGGGGWRFRSRMFSSSALSGLPSLAIAGAAGVFNADTMPVVLASLPAALIGIVLGVRLRPLVTDRRLSRITVTLLVATSLLAIVTAASALV